MGEGAAQLTPGLAPAGMRFLLLTLPLHPTHTPHSGVGKNWLILQHQLFNWISSFLDHFLRPMNIYRGIGDENSDQGWKHGRDEAPPLNLEEASSSLAVRGQEKQNIWTSWWVGSLALFSEQNAHIHTCFSPPTPPLLHGRGFLLSLLNYNSEISHAHTLKLALTSIL